MMQLPFQGSFGRSCRYRDHQAPPCAFRSAALSADWQEFLIGGLAGDTALGVELMNRGCRTCCGLLAMAADDASQVCSSRKLQGRVGAP